MFNSLFKKIMFSYLIIPVFVLIVLIILLPVYLKDFIFQNKEDELLQKAEIVSSAVRIEWPVRTGVQLALFEKILDTGIIVINENGDIVNRGERMKGLMKNRPYVKESYFTEKGEIMRVLKGEQVTFQGESPLVSKPVMVVGVPLDTDPVMALFLISPLEGLQEIVYRIRNLTLQVTLIAVGLALFLAYFITGSIVRPVKELEQKAYQIAGGDLNVRINNLPEDEIGSLGKSFNYMAEELDNKIIDLNTEKNRMQNMLNSMSEGVLGVSVDKKIILANPVLKDIFAIDKEIIEEPVERYLSDEIINLIESVMQKEIKAEIEFKWQGRIIIAQAAPVFKHEQQLWGSIILISDVTGIRKLDEMRELFVANVSHELKTPLTAMQGYIEAILDGVVDETTERRRYLERVLSEIKRMSRLAGEILDLSRLQSDQIEFQITTIDMVKVINSVLNNLKQRVEFREIELKSREEVYVKGDRDRIGQVLLNLLDNAIKFTAENGKITIIVEERQGFARVSVADNGQGIPQEELPYIWVRFHQADRSRYPGVKGAGLGLAIVKEIIEGLGGEVSVESREGRGSKFNFTLPLADI
jgi:signal transduction histidine kinase